MYSALKKLFNLNNQEEQHQKFKMRAKEIVSLLDRTPTGRFLLTSINDKQRLLVLVRQDVEGAVMVNPRLIKISAKVPLSTQICYLAHELRHSQQESRGLVLHRATSLLDTLVMVRFKEADAFAIEAQIAWELTEQQIQVNAWDEYKKGNFKFAIAYEKEAIRGGALNGKGMKAVFDAWFVSRYKNSYDQSSLQDSARQLESRSRGHAAYPLRDKKISNRMSLEYLQDTGVINNNINYLAHVNTHSNYYIGQISSKNERKISALLRRFPSAHMSSYGL